MSHIVRGEEERAGLGCGDVDLYTLFCTLIGIDTFRFTGGVFVLQDGITSSCSESGSGVDCFRSGVFLK